MNRVALVGISGVGKSTFLRRLSKEISFTHLEASTLLKEEVQLRQATKPTSEDLRLGAVLDNQNLLNCAFDRHVNDLDGLVVLDGHTIIDTGAELQEVPVSVFEKMHLDAFFFLQDDPCKILSRREADSTRNRPERNIDEITEHQSKAILTTARIAHAMRIPCTILSHGTKDTRLNLWKDVGPK